MQYVAATQDLASTHLHHRDPPPAPPKEDKVTRWLRENEGQMMMGPPQRRKGSSTADRLLASPKKRENLAADLCDALVGPAQSAKAPAPDQKNPSVVARKKRRTSSIMESLNSPRARLSFGAGRSSSPPRKQASFASSRSTQAFQVGVRRSVGGVLKTLDKQDDEEEEENVFFKPKAGERTADQMEETECVGGIERTRTGGGLVDFSSDSAKALIAEYEARFRSQASSSNGPDSQSSEASSSAPEAAAAAGVVRTKSGALVDFSSDSAKALIAEYEARIAKVEASAPPAAVAKEPEGVRSEEEMSAVEAEQEEDLPPTQPSINSVLLGVVAYVESRTGHENRSRCVEEVLESLGAAVTRKLTKEVTHMVFKDGSLATYNRGKRMGVHIVSNMWVEACKNEGRKVSEALFPSTSKDKYDSPGLFPKIRKAKSMQPKSDEEIKQRMEAQLNRMKNRNKNRDSKEKGAKKDKGKAAAGTPVTPKFPQHAYPVPLDYFNSPRPQPGSPKAAGSPSTRRNSVLNILDEARGEDPGALMVLTSPARARLNSSVESGGNPLGSPCTSEDFNTPLAKRLVRKYFSPATPSGAAAGAGSAGKGVGSILKKRRVIGGGLAAPPPTFPDPGKDDSDGEDIVDIRDASRVSGVEALPAAADSNAAGGSQHFRKIVNGSTDGEGRAEAKDDNSEGEDIRDIAAPVAAQDKTTVSGGAVKKRGRPPKGSTSASTTISKRNSKSGSGKSTRKRKTASNSPSEPAGGGVDQAGDSPQVQVCFHEYFSLHVLYLF